MKARGFWSLGGVSDVELVDELRQLVRRSGWTEARIVAHLAELETRRLHSRAGRSLFVYCQQELGLSQNEAYYRIAAARLARSFPIVFELLERREIHLTAIVLIVDYITAENHVELLRDVSGKTKEQILCLLAARAPRPDAKNKLRKLPVGARSVAAGSSSLLEPTSAERYRLQLNIGTQLKQKLEFLLDLTSHSNPSRDLAVVVERAVDTEIERVKKLRFGQTVRPRKARVDDGDADGSKSRFPQQHKETARLAAGEACCANDDGADGIAARAADETGRANNDGADARSERRDPDPKRKRLGEGKGVRKRKHISNVVRRELLERDGLGCTFVSPDGERCGARAFLQIHHDVAWSYGGSDNATNLRLLCAEHNRLLAEEDFGVSHITRMIQANRSNGTR